MSYRCPTCTMKFNRKEHARCGRCPTPQPTPSTLVIQTGEFWPKQAPVAPEADKPMESTHEST